MRAFALGAAALLASVSLVSPPRSLPSVLYGQTIDNTANISQVVAETQQLPFEPTTRVVFDVGNTVASYGTPVSDLNPTSYVMGELLDSSEEKSISTLNFNTRVNKFLAQTWAPKVDLWEVGNEVNGNWLGSYSVVEAKLAEAYNDVRNAGGKTAVTFYANEWTADNCGDGTSELTPEQFANQYMIPGGVTSPDYVFLSFYPTDCDIQGNNGEPTTAQVTSELENLHAIFPNALIGFGELGLNNPVTSTTLSQAEQIMNWGYSLNPALPYYVGGYFWWYADEDCVPYSTSLLFPSLSSAFNSEQQASVAGGW